MRVLLISPLPGLDPACGDIVYTETLLTHRPAGVQYESYAVALRRGALIEHGVRSGLKEALRHRRRITQEATLLAACRLINLARKRRLLFWEPFRFFSVRPGEYDVVHIHVFSARFIQKDCALVVSNAAPLRYLYTNARGYSPKRVDFMERCDINLSRLLKVNSNSYRLPQADRVIAFTDYLKQWYVERDVMAEDRVDVVPIFLPDSQPLSVVPKPGRVGFIAKDFDAKGGPTLLKAWETVRLERPDAELWIVGCSPRMTELEAASRNICWSPYVNREELLREILPSFAAFAYPTQFDGMPLVVLESLAQGVPVATSDYQAMPEIVGHGTSGLISPVGDATNLAQNILRLIDPKANPQYREAARGYFERTYSATTVQPRLFSAYQRAIDHYAGRTTGAQETSS